MVSEKNVTKVTLELLDRAIAIIVLKAKGEGRREGGEAVQKKERSTKNE